MTAPLLIGVDGGGSRCRAAIAGPDGRVLARAETGPANPGTDFARAVANVDAAIAAAALEAGLPARALMGAVVHLGLAGVMDAAMGRAVAEALPFARIAVTDDRPTGLQGALGGADGAVIAVGTGSYVGLRRGGTLRFAGGWGPVLGDEASGAWLGRRLLSCVCDAVDGLRPHSALTRAVLDELGAAGLPAHAAAAQPSDRARRAPGILKAAADGDALARDLAHQGSDWLVRALGAVGYTPDLPLCLIGGLGAAWLPWLPDGVRAAVRPARGDALSGAIGLAARQLAGAA